jgi:hypothetical protein
MATSDVEIRIGHSFLAPGSDDREMVPGHSCLLAEVNGYVSSYGNDIHCSRHVEPSGLYLVRHFLVDVVGRV